MKSAVRIKIKKGYKAAIYVKGKRGFTLCIVGPARILIVKLKKEQKGVKWV